MSVYRWLCLRKLRLCTFMFAVSMSRKVKVVPYRGVHKRGGEKGVGSEHGGGIGHPIRTLVLEDNYGLGGSGMHPNKDFQKS